MCAKSAADWLSTVTALPATRLSKPRSRFSLCHLTMNFNVGAEDATQNVPEQSREHPHMHAGACNHTHTLTLNVWHEKIYYHLSVLLSAASFLYLSSPNPEWDQRRSEKHSEPNRPGHCEPVHHHASQPRDQTAAERWGKENILTFTFSSSAL